MSLKETKGARAKASGAPPLKLFVACFILFAFAAQSFGPSRRAEAAQAGAKAADKGDFKVAPRKGGASKQPSDEEKALAETAAELNKIVSLPQDVYMSFDACGQPNAFYDPERKLITICYELAERFAEMFAEEAETEKELERAVEGAVAFVFFHELGHALVDVLDLPVTGKEEDAVDQLSTLILADGSDDGEEMVLYGALSFAQESDAELDALAFADEHSLDQQRFYNIICLLFGQNEKKYASLVSDGVLPEDRAARCPEEYSRLDKSWSKLLDPYLKQ